MKLSLPNIPVARNRLTEVTLLFLRLGLTAFGGPAAHIAMFRDEVVKRRKWIDDQLFLDLLRATNLIPGPNSTEMAIHLGFDRAGWAGLIAGGAAFIMPAMVIVPLIPRLRNSPWASGLLGVAYFRRSRHGVDKRNLALSVCE